MVAGPPTVKCSRSTTPIQTALLLEGWCHASAVALSVDRGARKSADTVVGADAAGDRRRGVRTGATPTDVAGSARGAIDAAGPAAVCPSRLAPVGPPERDSDPRRSCQRCRLRAGQPLRRQPLDAHAPAGGV